MARPIVEVEFNGKILNAILDTGAWRSYIRKDIAKDAPKLQIEPFNTKLGENTFTINEARLIEGFVKDTENRKYRFGEKLHPVDDLGKEGDKIIDILFGAVILEDWGTVIDETQIPPKVDFTRLREGVLVEL